MAQGKRDRLSTEQRIDMWRRWKSGESLHEIGRAFGKGHGSIRFLLTQLTGLTVNGRKFQVFSGAGSVIATEQGSKASPPGGILGQVGLAPATAPTSNQRLLLPPATQLRFVLIKSTTAARAVAANPRHRPAARIGTEPGLSPAKSIAASQQEPEIAYLCRVSDTPDRALPNSYYVAVVFKTSDSQALVERRWHEFLVATYPYRFANNPHVTAQCNRLTDPAADLSAREKLEWELKSENAGIVEPRCAAGRLTSPSEMWAFTPRNGFRGC